MELTEILTIVTIVVTWIFGALAKKFSWISTNLIPLQNIAIGLIIAVIEWIITKDFSTAIALSGILAGGAYDIFHNLEKIVKKESE